MQGDPFTPSGAHTYMHSFWHAADPSPREQNDGTRLQMTSYLMQKSQPCARQTQADMKKPREFRKPIKSKR
ncbi:hypothetical protein DPMN_078427 [Dreissena polymorpha]|uniref:Uncharacterized protein n=1 Tax=Dreissena polymorpha TaxID=45954 RepID=A0A9D3YRT3_DREPO|nr:hypothetical protein DPMN_078427 [Dreissena polymorpha]